MWLQPGDHPVFRRYAEFFLKLFRRFEVLDYRALYLSEGPRAAQRQVARGIDGAGPDIVIYTQFPNSFSYLTPEFVSSLKRRATVVGFGFDDEIYFDQSKFFYQSCSAVITSDIAGAEWLKRAGVPAYVAQLQQPHVNGGLNTAAEDIDVSFVGDISKPGRRDYVHHLESNGIQIADYGAGSRNGRLSDAGVVDVFRRSRINLNFTATNPPAWILRHNPERARVAQIKGRPFELAALGRFCLCEWAPCVEHWFRPGIDIGVFRDAHDLLVQTRKYLGDDNLRRRISAEAHRRYRAELTPEVQFTRLFADILAMRDQRAPTVQSEFRGPFFYESMGRSRGVAVLHALHRGSPIRALREIVTEWLWRVSYWRGLLGGFRDGLVAGLRRT